MMADRKSDDRGLQRTELPQLLLATGALAVLAAPRVPRISDNLFQRVSKLSSELPRAARRALLRKASGTGDPEVPDLLLLLRDLQRGTGTPSPLACGSLCVSLCAQIVYDLLVPRGKNTPKTGRSRL